MISVNLLKKLNEYLNLSFEASYFFLSMSSYTSSLDKMNTSNLFREESENELNNAMLLYKYILKRGQKILFQPIEKPIIKNNLYFNIKKAFSYKNLLLNNLEHLINMSLVEKDYATKNFLENLGVNLSKSELEFEELLKCTR